MKKTFTAIIITMITILGAVSVHAQNMEMYVGGHYTVRDVQNIAGFDMLPIEDIAPELGFTTWFDGYELTLYGTDRTYYFHVGDPNVWDNAGGWYGLDVTPRVMEGKIRIPNTWLIYSLGLKYSYDNITNTLFIDSDYTYNWLRSTKEYQDEVARREWEQYKQQVRAYNQTMQGLDNLNRQLESELNNALSVFDPAVLFGW